MSTAIQLVRSGSLTATQRDVDESLSYLSDLVRDAGEGLYPL